MTRESVRHRARVRSDSPAETDLQPPDSDRCSANGNLFARFPQPVNIAVGHSVQRTRL
jgi:hypothetical protein